MDISHFIKVTCNGRKLAVPCDGNLYDEFLKNVSERFNIPEDNLEITTSDDTEIDNLFFKTLVKSEEQLFARDRTVCKSKESTETGLHLQSPASSLSSKSLSPSQPTINIPWNKIPSSIIQTFEDEELLDKKQRSLLVKVLWEEIKQDNMRISRKVLREVSARVIRRHPRCFEKRIDGMLISDGIEELMLSLEWKRDNENRPESSKPKKACLESSTSVNNNTD